MCGSFCSISLVTNMLEGWDIIHWKGGIYSFVWSTKTFLCDIREPRYKQIKMEYQTSKCLDIEKSSVRNKSKTIWDNRFEDTKIVQYSNILKSDTLFYSAYISAPKYCTEKFLYSRRSYGSHLSNELCPSFLACL